MIVPFLLGSKVDLDHAKVIAKALDDYGVKCEIYVSSAHKVPEKTLEIIKKFNEKKETVVWVTMAGRSNALSGLVSANSHFPVIACPPFKDYADYLANVHSSLQMPGETPAMTVVDPKNAAQAVVRILALADKDLAKKVKNHIKVVQNSFDTKPVSIE
ncbi:MAG: AIR carboxylase family protein [Patescibacteria group bacterium]